MALPLRRDDDPSPRPGPAAVTPPAACIVVAGESNSGKSSVVNLLLRRPVLPVSAAAGDIALVSLHPAARRCYRALGPGGSLMEEPAPDALVTRPGLARLEVEVVQPGPAPLVIHEVVLAQDRPPTDSQRAALAAADLLIWCTMAQRAWSRTEIALVDALPAHLLGGALLAVTRSDLLSGEKARARVRERLEREVQGRFAAIVLLECGRAGQDGLNDPAEWRRRGGEALARALQAGLAGKDRRADAPPGPPRLADVAAAMARAVRPEDTAAKAAPLPVAAEIGWPATLDDLLDAAARDPAPDARRLAAGLAGAMARVLDSLPGGPSAAGRLRRAYTDELARICGMQEAGTFGAALPLLADLALQFEEDLAAAPPPNDLT